MMSFSFRDATCHEAFKDFEYRDGCRVIKEAGYSGIEIAAFTLDEDPTALTATDRANLCRLIQQEALTYVRLHSIMLSPKRLHVRTPGRGSAAAKLEAQSTT